MVYFLDTNILVALVKRQLDEQKELLRVIDILPEDFLLISVVNIGELKALALKNKWGAKRMTSLDAIRKNYTTVDINVETIINRYAEIDAYSQRKLVWRGQLGNFSSRNMGKNDLWIAATASVLSIPFITTDQDFDHLHEVFLDVRRVEPASFK